MKYSGDKEAISLNIAIRNIRSHTRYSTQYSTQYKTSLWLLMFLGKILRPGNIDNGFLVS
jgi:hypothetical protein